MPLTPDYLRETHLIGSRCREWVLDRANYPQLRVAQLVWVGHGELLPPYRMVRLRSPYSHIVACFGGQGSTIIDGEEVPWGAGQVLLAPVGALHAFEVRGSGPWKIAWVFFDDQKGPPVIPEKKTRLVRAEAGDFCTSLQMLTREASGAQQPFLLQSLVAVVEAHARRLAGSAQIDSRLWRMWEKVEGDLGRDWDNRSLAKAATLSEEHLRRLCHKYYHRSPVAHLLQIRMQRASMLLSSSPAKIDDIAQQVGFSGIYAFSAAFKRWSGSPPSMYRKDAP